MIPGGRTTTAGDASREAILTSADYLAKALLHIDDQLGKGYAKRNPELVAAFMLTAAHDYFASWAIAEATCAIVSELRERG